MDNATDGRSAIKSTQLISPSMEDFACGSNRASSDDNSCGLTSPIHTPYSTALWPQLRRIGHYDLPQELQDMVSHPSDTQVEERQLAPRSPRNKQQVMQHQDDQIQNCGPSQGVEVDELLASKRFFGAAVEDATTIRPLPALISERLEHPANDEKRLDWGGVFKKLRSASAPSSISENSRRSIDVDSSHTHSAIAASPMPIRGSGLAKFRLHVPSGTNISSQAISKLAQPPSSPNACKVDGAFLKPPAICAVSGERIASTLSPVTALDQAIGGNYTEFLAQKHADVTIITNELLDHIINSERVLSTGKETLRKIDAAQAQLKDLAAMMRADSEYRGVFPATLSQNTQQQEDIGTEEATRIIRSATVCTTQGQPRQVLVHGHNGTQESERTIHVKKEHHTEQDMWEPGYFFLFLMFTFPWALVFGLAHLLFGHG